MSRKSYSKEFKESAVRLLVMEGMSAAEVSQQLGVRSGLLYRWKQQQAISTQIPGVDADAQAMIASLRKQLARSEKINEILKKTVAYFAETEQEGKP